MRTELKRVGCIEEVENGSLKLVKRYVVPADVTDNLVASLVHGIYPHLSTLMRNTDPERNHEGMPNFNAFSLHIRGEDLNRLRRISYDRLSAAAESFDDLFIAYESLNADAEDAEGVTVSVGLFYFEENDPHAKYTW